ncbi:uncharacterized protein DUF2868 [Nitrosomonas sp. Nm84]|uniref:DUF2868 domain-containing protein n=1 Tax=Nitrosomonas sp. Nm84 TaxID=200124 RepID=UPI000D769EF9|nr:DUF2868 domain-containing protein [Nitrosomonas sp. Nm84]PXW88903.1 uncharacterized protein DUF2868 [Nitrosomonas sp. Nm84]
MSVKRYTFADLVRIEQVRKIESAKAEDLSYASIQDMPKTAGGDFNYADFIQRLNTRAKRLIQENTLNDALQQPRLQFIRARRICLALAVILGGLAASEAVSESTTLNIYWLLAVLLGFNLISLLLWLSGITLNLQSLSSGIVAQLASWLPYRHKKDPTIASLASHAWWESCLTGGVGKWRISVLTHQFWLVYLSAGMILLILLMLAQQYNFIWGTTLLPDSTLPKLTQILGTPLQALGLTIPDDSQAIASRIGADKQDAETRTAWATFLIGTLLVYGILPRLLVLGLSVIMQKWREHRFRLDLYLPYYIELRQRLMAREVKAEVIDADPYAGAKPVDVTLPPANVAIPANAQAFGIELDAATHWPESVICRLNIVDQNSHDEAIALIKNLGGPLLLGVAAHRLPDRGVQRLIKELVDSSNEKPWLILLSKPSAPVASTREFAWFRLAEACGIPAEHVITR